MKNNKFTIFLGVLVAASVFGGGLFVYYDFKEANNNSDVVDKDPPESVITDVQKEEESMLQGGDARIGADSLDVFLNRPVVVPSHISSDTANLVRQKIEEMVSVLRENTDDAESLLELGIYRKMIEDYEGARQIWEYVRDIRPGDGRPLNNLANLYGYYLHDQKNAERYYLEAIAREPQQIYFYAALFEYYFDGLGDEAKAKAILEKGIAANPNNSQGLRDLLNKFF